MTEEELKETITARLVQAYTNPKTVRTYRGALTRLLGRVPVSLMGDARVMRSYRQLLSPSLRSLFGVLWPKVYEELTQRGLPCVEPRQLIYQTRLPSITAYSVDVLSVPLGFPALASSKWGMLHTKEDGTYLGRVRMGKECLFELRRLADYYWPEGDPDPSAPIIPVNREARDRALPNNDLADMVEDLNRGEKIVGPERLPYQVYLRFSELQYPLKDIEQRLEDMEQMDKLPRYQRGVSRRGLLAVIAALDIRDHKEAAHLWLKAKEGVAPEYAPEFQVAREKHVAAAMQSLRHETERPPSITSQRAPPVAPVVPRQPIIGLAKEPRAWRVRMNVAD